MRKAAPRDRQIRLEGGGNLHRAALETGVKRYIVQSAGFFYGRGQGLASEEDPLAHDASPGVAGSVATYRQIENRVFGSPCLDGVALRYGFFTVQAPTMTRRLEASPNLRDPPSLLSLGSNRPLSTAPSLV